MPLKTISGPFGLLDKSLLPTVDSVFAGENFLQAVLHAHLLLERSLDASIAKHLRNPTPLGPDGQARLTFAQKVALYVALNDPRPSVEARLLAFNRLRNTIAHKLVDVESEAVRLLLPALKAAIAEDGGKSSPPSDARSVTMVVFGGLMLFDLQAIDGVKHEESITSSLVESHPP